MKLEVLSEQQAISLMVLFISGSAVVLSIGGQAGGDIWLAVILSGLLALPIVTVYARLHSLYPHYDAFQIIIVIFGNTFGRLICLVYTWFAFHLGALVLRNFGEFIITVGLEETPQLFPVTLFALLCLWIVKEGIEVLGRWSNFFFRFAIIIVLITTALALPELNMDHFRPFLFNGIMPVLQGTANVFAFPFAQTIVLWLAFSGFQKRSSPYRIYWLGILMGTLVILIITTLVVAIIGVEIYKHSYFPAYIAIARLNIADFVQRLEIIVAIMFIISSFVKVSTCLLATCKGVAAITNFHDYRFTVTPITLLMISTSYFLFDDIMQMLFWAQDIWPIYAFPFQVILPIIVLIGGEYRAKSLKKQ